MSKHYDKAERVAYKEKGNSYWKIPCYGCGKSREQVSLRKVVIDEENNMYWLCSHCLSGAGPTVPDVWYGYGSGTHTEENICDPKTGQPIPFSSRQGKAEAMRRAGVVEAGDRVHGTRSNFTGKRSSVSGT